MTALRILASASPGEVRVALLDGDLLREAWVDRPDAPDGVGDLQRARVTALAPAMAGAFLALAGGETGFLPESEADGPRPIGRAVTEGQILPVRVLRAAQGGKGPRVSARLAPAQRAQVDAAPPGTPMLVARGPGALLRLAAAYPDAPVATDSAALAASLRPSLGARLAVLPGPAFDDALEAEWELLAGPEVPLPGGGRLLIQPTPALVAIDVDAGPAAAGRDPLAQERLNAAALAEAARQIRLRNLAGAILLDCAGMAAKRRAVLEAPLKQALGGDALVQYLGLGPLGLFELRRSRIHPPLHEVLGWPPSPLTCGLAALRRAIREAAASPGRALALRAHPSVLAALQAGQALQNYAQGAGRPLALQPDTGLAPGREELCFT